MIKKETVAGKEHKTKTSYPVLVRYIFVFLLFSLILLVLFIPVYSYIADFTLKNEISSMNEKLENGVLVLDSAVMTLSNIVITTSRDSRYRLLKHDSPVENFSPFALRELQANLNNLILSQPIIADIGIILSGNNVLTKNYIFYFSELYSFYDQFFSCGDFSYTDWLSQLRANRPFAPLQEYNSRDYGKYQAITFSATWDSINYPDDAVLFATIPVKSIIPLLVDNETAAKSYIRISDIFGNNLIDLNNAGGLNIKQERFHILNARSNISSLIFEIGIPHSLINEKMAPVRNLLLLFSGCAAIIILTMSFIFAHKSSEPLRQFLSVINNIKNIRTVPDNNGKKGRTGNFKTFRQIFSDVSSGILTIDTRLEASLKTIEQQAQLLKAQIFDSALQKGTYTADDLRQFQSVFSDFPGKFRLACIYYGLPENSTFENALTVQIEIINNIKNFREGGCFGQVYIHGKDGNTIIMLLPTNENDIWHEKLTTLRNALNSGTDTVLSFALSDIFYKPSEICRAWQQLQFIHALSDSNYMADVERTGDVPAGNIQLPISINALGMIYNSLNNADDTTACSILNDSVTALANLDDDLIINTIYDGLVNMLMRLKLEKPSVLYDINIPVYIKDKQRKIFEKDFPECFREIGMKIRNKNQDSITIFGQKIVDFINEHLYDPNLYITMVLDHFQISHPTLQKLIKKISGQTFFTYVENQRLAKAHEMLMTGKLSVQEVAAKCGFTKAASFYKAFKRNYGFAPSKTASKSVIE